MKIIMIVLVAIFVTGIFLSQTTDAFCWSCTPKRCMFDLDCDIGCWCYKGWGDIEGNCVTK